VSRDPKPRSRHARAGSTAGLAVGISVGVLLYSLLLLVVVKELVQVLGYGR
jgi:hypothetical protein